MSSNSSIEWTDATWNPVTGCTRASAGCDNCYAVTMTRRLAAMGQEKYKDLVNPGKGHFNGVVKTHDSSLDIPLRRKKPTMYFVNSMSDLFHKDVPFWFIDKVFAVMALAPQHTFQILTKRPERMAFYMNDVYALHIRNIAWSLSEDRLHEIEWPLPNVWLGTSVENQETADERIPHLLKTPAAVRWLSCEPLLGPIDLDQIHTEHRSITVNCLTGLPYDWDYGTEEPEDADLDRTIGWVVGGGESGRNARPMHPQWARDIRDACKSADVPFFYKQHGKYIHEDQIWEDPHGLTEGYRYFGANKIARAIEKMGSMEGLFNAGRLHQFEDTSFAIPVGKHKAGRHLDGRTHDQLPLPRRTEETP